MVILQHLVVHLINRNYALFNLTGEEYKNLYSREEVEDLIKDAIYSSNTISGFTV